MNKHTEQDQIALYLDGQLSEKEGHEVDLHLKSCESCRIETGSQQNLKLRFSKMARHSAPPNLLKQLRKEYGQESWWQKSPSRRYVNLLWKPVGVFTVATAVLSVWLVNRTPDGNDYMDLEPLMARHTRYRAESTVPPADMFASNYSAHLASYKQGVHE